jgi:hypothetical protein
MQEVVKQLPFLVGVFAISWWLCPDDVFEDAFEDLDLVDTALFAGSFVAFLTGCLASYVVALESMPTDWGRSATQ